MKDINDYIIYREGRELVREVAKIASRIRFGNLQTQVKSSTTSVVSNFREGHGRGTTAAFAHFCRQARASVNEAQTQLEISADLGFIPEDHPTIELSSRIGKRLTCFIRKLE